MSCIIKWMLFGVSPTKVVYVTHGTPAWTIKHRHYMEVSKTLSAPRIKVLLLITGKVADKGFAHNCSLFYLNEWMNDWLTIVDLQWNSRMSLNSAFPVSCNQYKLKACSHFSVASSTCKTIYCLSFSKLFFFRIRSIRAKTAFWQDILLKIVFYLFIYLFQ